MAVSERAAHCALRGHPEVTGTAGCHGHPAQCVCDSVSGVHVRQKEFCLRLQPLASQRLEV